MLGFTTLFHIDNLSLIMLLLVGFVGLSVTSFSARYLRGDRKQQSFYLNLSGLLSSIFMMVCADNILLLLVTWFISNYLLTQLMLHKREWGPARQSSRLARNNFSLSGMFLGSALLILYWGSEETSIQAILNASIATLWLLGSAIFMLLAAMAQSALWPFHRWLISSLNTPTSVSAIMHAGLINGGGFLLARFAPIFIEQPLILNLLFTLGMLTAILGTLWKLMQSDIKRMLACSTMGQMGFMIAQCGLGLFPAAVAHLCWHGLFKAYLFLASGAAAQEKRLDLEEAPSTKIFSLAVICGALGAYMFSLVSHKSIFAADTTLLLILVALLAGIQFALPIIRSRVKANLLLALVATPCIGVLYGFSVYLVENALAPMSIWAPQPLNILHVLGLIALSVSWAAIRFARQSTHKEHPQWLLKNYVRMLNASQPHPKTVTAHRNHYQF